MNNTLTVRLTLLSQSFRMKTNLQGIMFYTLFELANINSYEIRLPDDFIVIP